MAVPSTGRTFLHVNGYCGHVYSQDPLQYCFGPVARTDMFINLTKYDKITLECGKFDVVNNDGNQVSGNVIHLWRYSQDHWKDVIVFSLFYPDRSYTHEPDDRPTAFDEAKEVLMSCFQWKG